MRDHAAIELEGRKYIPLATLIELKLASGMTNAHRLKDLADVQAQERHLPRGADGLAGQRLAAARDADEQDPLGQRQAELAGLGGEGEAALGEWPRGLPGRCKAPATLMALWTEIRTLERETQRLVYDAYGLTPAEAAKLVGMPETQLRELNLIPERMLVRVGSTLLVPRGAGTVTNVAGHIADHATMELAPEARPPRLVSVRIGKKGETVSALARRYGLRTTQVAAMNGVAPAATFAATPVATVVTTVPAEDAILVTSEAPANAPAQALDLLNQPAAP